MITKNEFIKKWSVWWKFEDQSENLTFAFEQEVNKLIEFEKNRHITKKEV